jgi:HicA toxin of bacterial toxin-antitoxin,
LAKSDKALERLKSIPKDFNWNELVSILKRFGYRLQNSSGGGSARRFTNESTKHRIFLHEPHPTSIVKAYALRQVVESLQEVGVIDREIEELRENENEDE